MPLLILLLACALLAFAPLVSWSQAENTESATNPAPALDSPSPKAPMKLPPMESQPKAQPLSLEQANRIPEDIREDLHSLRKDLDHALKLLEETEDDPEIHQAIRQLQERLQSLRLEQTQLTDAARLRSR
jgi:hypothetical protein